MDTYELLGKARDLVHEAVTVLEAVEGTSPIQIELLHQASRLAIWMEVEEEADDD